MEVQIMLNIMGATPKLLSCVGPQKKNRVRYTARHGELLAAHLA